ncbi:hypothetical protein DSO57_1008832 [Entomophthora muscae]|uniref:Uncharacterized protein n=1 Tax=Entomophthora muscae TaxID=34485 RepID=A0ACC2RLT1_9FUNG|nr:hypothetical protein DSO57_1008832 [Entomophthora muscae]
MSHSGTYPIGIAEVLPSNSRSQSNTSYSKSSICNVLQAKIELQKSVDDQINESLAEESEDEAPPESAALAIRKTVMGLQPLFPSNYFTFALQYVIYPFVGGVMGGFGEMLALEFGIWMGWGSAALFYFGRNPKS